MQMAATFYVAKCRGGLWPSHMCILFALHHSFIIIFIPPYMLFGITTQISCVAKDAYEGAYLWNRPRCNDQSKQY
jgi:hypothetical protein